MDILSLDQTRCTHNPGIARRSSPGENGIAGVVGAALGGAMIGTVAGPLGTAIGAAIGAIAASVARTRVAESAHPMIESAILPANDPLEYEPPVEIGAAFSHEAIARCAYEIWERKGRFDGHALDDWLQAESFFSVGSVKQDRSAS